MQNILENFPKQCAAVTTYCPSQMRDPPQMWPVPLPPSRGFHSPLQVGPFHPSHWRPNETIHGQSCSFLISHPPTIFSHAGRFSFLFFSAPRDPSKAKTKKLIILIMNPFTHLGSFVWQLDPSAFLIFPFWLFSLFYFQVHRLHNHISSNRFLLHQLQRLAKIIMLILMTFLIPRL